MKRIVIPLIFAFATVMAGCGKNSDSSGNPPSIAKQQQDTAQATTANDATPLAADATQRCRATLHRIYGAKAQWALENRKTQDEIPTDADLFGPGRYMPEEPKCPSSGSYTLGTGRENPRCSISGHTY